MRNQTFFICPREVGNKETSRSTHHGICLFSTWQAHDLSQSTSCWPLFTCLILKASTQNLRVAIGSSQVIALTNQKKEKKANEEVKKKMNLHCFYLRHFPALIRSWSWDAQDQPRPHLFRTTTQLHHRSRFGNNLFQYCWRPRCYIDYIQVIPTFFKLKFTFL